MSPSVEGSSESSDIPGSPTRQAPSQSSGHTFRVKYKEEGQQRLNRPIKLSQDANLRLSEPTTTPPAAEQLIARESTDQTRRNCPPPPLPPLAISAPIDHAASPASGKRARRRQSTSTSSPSPISPMMNSSTRRRKDSVDDGPPTKSRAEQIDDLISTYEGSKGLKNRDIKDRMMKVLLEHYDYTSPEISDFESLFKYALEKGVRAKQLLLTDGIYHLAEPIVEINTELTPKHEGEPLAEGAASVRIKSSVCGETSEAGAVQGSASTADERRVKTEATADDNQTRGSTSPGEGTEGPTLKKARLLGSPPTSNATREGGSGAGESQIVAGSITSDSAMEVANIVRSSKPKQAPGGVIATQNPEALPRKSPEVPGTPSQTDSAKKRKSPPARSLPSSGSASGKPPRRPTPKTDYGVAFLTGEVPQTRSALLQGAEVQDANSKGSFSAQKSSTPIACDESSKGVIQGRTREQSAQQNTPTSPNTTDKDAKTHTGAAARDGLVPSREESGRWADGTRGPAPGMQQSDGGSHHGDEPKSIEMDWQGTAQIREVSRPVRPERRHPNYGNQSSLPQSTVPHTFEPKQGSPAHRRPPQSGITNPSTKAQSTPASTSPHINEQFYVPVSQIPHSSTPIAPLAEHPSDLKRRSASAYPQLPVSAPRPAEGLYPPKRQVRKDWKLVHWLDKVRRAAPPTSNFGIPQPQTYANTNQPTGSTGSQIYSTSVPHFTTNFAQPLPQPAPPASSTVQRSSAANPPQSVTYTPPQSRLPPSISSTDWQDHPSMADSANRDDTVDTALILLQMSQGRN
ncbi:hypothetical protein HDV00_007662 [Rhizophlyctis rosea]|nr:hypothetical protein HDV00_007662 [Rhizophlyctis rosea]